MFSQSLESCLTLCSPVDCSPPGPTVHRVLQGKILAWTAISSSSGSFWPRDWTQVFCIAGGFLNTEPPEKPFALHNWKQTIFLKKIFSSIKLRNHPRKLCSLTLACLLSWDGDHILLLKNWWKFFVSPSIDSLQIKRKISAFPETR